MLRAMLRICSLSKLVISAGLSLLPAAALAQMQGPPTPLAMDLSKVPVGSSASYTMTMGTLPPMSMRMALVGKSTTGNTLEMSVEGGMTASVGKVVTAVTVPPSKQGEGVGPVKKVIMQVGSNDPMEMPVNPGQSQQFTKPNPKNLLKTETLKVPAGSFKTKHYRDKSPQGDVIDYWVADNAPPIGLVRIEMDAKSNAMIKGQIKLELNALTTDAKPTIVQAPKPFDQTALMKEMMGGASPPPGAGK
jgi:hypothetical protein